MVSEQVRKMEKIAKPLCEATLNIIRNGNCSMKYIDECVKMALDFMKRTEELLTKYGNSAEDCIIIRDIVQRFKMLLEAIKNG